jgi:hypothetical protein
MTRATDDAALDRLIEQEDVLQICYWYQGEGFGDRFTPAAVTPFLKGDSDVADTFHRLTEAGDLQRDGAEWVFTAEGRRKAGRMFFETFTEFQQASHGECNAGCCDGEEVCDDPAHGHHVHG